MMSNKLELARNDDEDDGHLNILINYDVVDYLALHTFALLKWRIIFANAFYENNFNTWTA